MIPVIYSILWLFAAWRLGDWHNWRKYYPTLLFSSIGNLLYEIICAEYPMWAMEKNGLPNRTLSILLLSLIGMPVSTLIYLSHFPFHGTKIRKALYILVFILIFTVLEFVAVQFGSITYHNDWNLGWSIVFLIIMFPILAVHHRKPILALLLSIVVTIGFAAVFHVTLDKMK